LSLAALLASFSCFRRLRSPRCRRRHRHLVERARRISCAYGAIAAVIGGSLWYGGDEKLGHTFWESLDSMVLSGVTAEVAKRAFGRRRPSDTPDPNDWWNGSCCKSFPSGEVTLQASVVTPVHRELCRRATLGLGPRGIAGLRCDRRG
jgi:hypothetical protein